MSHRARRSAPLLVAIALVALAGLVAACGSSGGGAPTPAVVAADAVLVPADYQPPADHVDRTGAFIPANGKPTLVFVDAIW
jgi:hypothetical protein